MRIGILGGGMDALVCAHQVLKGGHVPVVLETGGELGGTRTQIEHEGSFLDRTPQTLLDTDSALCGLMADIGGLGRLSWSETRRGVLANDQTYSLDTPDDLFRFASISVSQRLRAGVANFYLTHGRRYGLDLDGVAAPVWLRKLFGEGFYEKIWAPLLEARFGDSAEEAPAYWAWQVLNRHMRGRPAVRGSIRGGSRWLTQQLRHSIERRGGELHLDASLSGLDSLGPMAVVGVNGAEEMFDAVISTLPLPQMTKIASTQLLNDTPLLELEYNGLVSVLVAARSPLSSFFETTLLDADFQMVVETTKVISPRETAGRHLIYLLNRCGSHTASYMLSDDVVKKQALECLKSLNAGFDLESIELLEVSRNPHAEPLWTTGQLERRPKTRIGRSPVYLCTSAQAYPRIPGWDTSVALAREAVAELISDFS